MRRASRDSRAASAPVGAEAAAAPGGGVVPSAGSLPAGRVAGVAAGGGAFCAWATRAQSSRTRDEVVSRRGRIRGKGIAVFYECPAPPQVLPGQPIQYLRTHAPMPETHTYPIGTPGQPWGAAERDQWRTRQVCQRSYADDVLTAIEALRGRFDVELYGDVVYANDQHPSERFQLRAILLVVPCVSPWAYERFQRRNFDAIDPNRSFKEGSLAQESLALMRLVAQHQGQYGQFTAHIDLHETTDTDESEYRPAVAARDGKVFEPGSIPDGFYLVDDTENPQPAFQQAIIEAVGRVTHIAPADDKNEIIVSPVVAPGVIRYQLKAWGLCASVTEARYTTTTEVYPDSPRATPEQCIAAQVAAVCAAVEFVCGAQ